MRNKVQLRQLMKLGSLLPLATAICGAAGMPPAPTPQGAEIQRFGDKLLDVLPEDNEPVHFVLALPLRNQAALNEFLENLYTPGSPMFHQFISPAEFDSQFGPTNSSYEALKVAANRAGLTIEREVPGHYILDVSGTVANVRGLFGVQMRSLQTSDGSVYSAPDREPSVPVELTALGATVSALNNRPIQRQGIIHPAQQAPSIAAITPVAGSGLRPSDIRKAYNFGNIQYSGGKIAVLEVQSATYSDVTYYASYFGLQVPTINVINIDGGTTATANVGEVILDLEMIVASSNTESIDVYSAPPTIQAEIGAYASIASAAGNYAAISTSWTQAETTNSGQAQSEQPSFQKMVAAGATLFAASGDYGAYTDASGLSVNDPASSPYVTGVGGTVLTLNSSQNYVSEAAWGDPGANSYSPFGFGGGGGISILWSIPSYQQGIVSAAPAGQFSSTHRNVPDVSLSSSFDVAGSEYYTYITVPGQPAQWYTGGGTSFAAPLWAGFWSLVGTAEKIVGASSTGSAGFANPPIYSLAKTPSSYARDFHDVTSGNNLHYSAVSGYDTATGWGSMNGANLLADVVSGVAGALPNTPANLTISTIYLCGATLSWTASTTPGVTYSVFKGDGSFTSAAQVASGLTQTNSIIDIHNTSSPTYWWVQAVAASGRKSYPSNSVESDLPALCGPKRR